MNNRKRTKGRNFIYVKNDEGKTIKQIIESKNHKDTLGLMFKLAMQYDRPRTPASEKTLRRRVERNRKRLAWNSKEKGTFVGSTKDLVV